LRIAARPLGISRIDATAESILVQFIANPKVDAGKIIRLVHNNAEYSFSGPNCLRIKVQIEGVPDRAVKINSVIKELSGSKIH